MKKNKEYFIYSAITIIVAVFSVVGIIYAWTEPTAAPPTGNVPAPINTGSASQYKIGRMGANTTGIDLNYGFTIGSDGIKVGGDSYFEGKINATNKICDSTGCIGDNGSLWSKSGSNSNIYYNSGNVGIRATAPGAELTIGDIYSAGGKNLLIGDDSYLTDIDTANFLGIYGNQNSDRAGIRLGSDGSYIFGDNGNVGIGTTNPGYKLTVSGPIGTPNMNHPYLVLDSNGSGSNNNEQSAQISLGESGRGSASLHLSYIGDGYSYIGMGNLGSDNIPDHWAMKLHYTDNDIYAHNNINANDVYIRALGKWASALGGSSSLWTDSGSYIHPKNYTSFAIKDNGRVGIGTTNPSYRLQAQGDIYANGGWLRVSGQKGIYFQSYGGGWYMQDSNYIRNYGSKRVYLNNYLYAPRIYDQNNTGYYLDPNSTSRLNSIRFDGELKPDGATCSNGQILKKKSSNKWECVDMPGGGGISGSGSANYIPKWTGGTSLGNSVIYQSGSNIGIGTTGPTQKLDVSGYVKGRSGLCMGNDCRTSWPSGGGSGDITAVYAGTGLSGGGASGDVTLSADTSYLQRRVSGTCAAGSSIRVINSNGTVTCEPDDTGGGSSGCSNTYRYVQSDSGRATAAGCSDTLGIRGGTGISTSRSGDNIYINASGGSPSLSCTYKSVYLGGNSTAHANCSSPYQRTGCSAYSKNIASKPNTNNGCDFRNPIFAEGAYAYTICCKIQ